MNMKVTPVDSINCGLDTKWMHIISEVKLSNLNILVGEHGAGKSSIIEGIRSKCLFNCVTNLFPRHTIVERLRDDKNLHEKIDSMVKVIFPYFNRFDGSVRWFNTDEEERYLDRLPAGVLKYVVLALNLLTAGEDEIILIDDVENSLSSLSIHLIANLIKETALTRQIIVSTKSPIFLNEFKIEDLIILENDNGNVCPYRLNSADFKAWLEDFLVGELWSKGVLTARGGSSK